MTRFAPLPPPRVTREGRAIETWARRFRALGASPETAYRLARNRIGVAVGAVAFGAGVVGTVIASRRVQDAPSGHAPPHRVSSVAPRPRPVAVVWLGPVARAQVTGAELAGVPVVHLPCTGDGSPSCSQIADSYLDGDGRRLPGLRRALRLPAGPLVLAAFSAGGHIVRHVLADARDRAASRGHACAAAESPRLPPTPRALSA